MTDLGEYIYGSCLMSDDLIIHSMNHRTMMMVKWLDYSSQHTREIFTDICIECYQFLIT